MNQNIKDKWLLALRSGRFEQGTDYLRQQVSVGGPDTFCCLGVLCEIAVMECVIPEPRLASDSREYGYANSDEPFESEFCQLPPAVQAWAECSGNPTVRLDELTQFDGLPEVLTTKEAVDSEGRDLVSLANLNDSGASFEQIATIIEELL